MSSLIKRRENLKHELDEFVKSIKDEFSKFELEDFESMGSEVTYRKNDVVLITIIGSMKAGKSSFVNEFFTRLVINEGNSEEMEGEEEDEPGSGRIEVCPVESQAWTKVIWKIEYGEKNQVVLKRRDGKIEQRDLSNDVFSEEFDDVLYDLSEEIRGYSGPEKKGEEFDEIYHREIIVQLKLDFLKTMSLCDSPGEGETEELQRLIIENACQSDLFVFITEVNRGCFSQRDSAFLREIISEVDRRNKHSRPSLEKRMIVVGNKIDECVQRRKRNLRRTRSRDLKKLCHDRKIEILRKLNEGNTLFCGRFKEENVYVTCCVDKKVFGEQVFKPLFQQVERGMLRVREKYLFEIPVLKSLDQFLERMKMIVSQLEVKKKFLREKRQEMEEVIKEIKDKSPETMKGLHSLQKQAIERLRNDLLKFFEEKEKIMEEVCRDEVDRDYLSSFWPFNRKKGATKYIHDKLNAVLQNRIQMILRKNVNEFLQITQDKLDETIRQILKNRQSGIGRVALLGGGAVVGAGAIGGVGIGIVSALAAVAIIGSGGIALIPIGLLGGLFFGTLGGGAAITAWGSGSGFFGTSGSKKGSKFDLKWRESQFETFWKDLEKDGKIVEEVEKKFTESTDDFLSSLQEKQKENYEMILKKEKLEPKDLDYLLELLVRRAVDLLDLRHRVLEGYGNDENVESSKFGKLDITSAISMGSFGGVHTARIGGDFGEKEVAVKIPYKMDEGYLKEIFTLYSLVGQSKRIVEFISCKKLLKDVEKDLSLNEDKIVLIMEKKEKNLANVISSPQLSLVSRLELMIQVAEGVSFMHENDLFHRDLKPENVLLSGGDENDVFLCDFGLTKHIGLSKGTVCGTKIYLDPLVFRSPDRFNGRDLGHRKIYGKKIDVYSFGLILAEIWEMKRVFEKKHRVFKKVEDFVEGFLPVDEDVKVLEDLSENIHGDIGESIRKEFQELVNGCTCLNEKKRFSILYVLEKLNELKNKIEKM